MSFTFMVLGFQMVVALEFQTVAVLGFQMVVEQVHGPVLDLNNIFHPY
jgi:hypothetical protein